jgi:hypothetical protein
LSDAALERALNGFTTGLGRRIDLLGFDACLMGAWEVASAVAPFADVLVAAPELVPSAGWPLARVLARLKQYEATATARDFSAEIAREFQRASRHHLLLSVLDLTGVAAIDLSLDEMSRAALVDRCQLRSEWLSGAYRYRESDTVDLAALAKSVERAGCSAEMRTAASKLTAALDESRISVTCQPSSCGSGGLTLHLPLERPEQSYLDPAAAWNRHTHWSKWLQASSPIRTRVGGLR